MTRRGVIGLLAGCASLALVGCDRRGDPNKVRETPGGGRIWPPFRFRLTVEVETPEGLRAGSSVIEVRKREAGRFAIVSPGAVDTKIVGEAAAVDLPGGKTLFALLRSDDDRDWAGRVLHFVIPRQTIEQRVESPDPFAVSMERILALRGVHALPRWFEPGGGPPGEKVSGYPMLVTFADVADPKSVQRVDPNDLAPTFGKGVKLKRITVERTDAPVTIGIEKRLPWLSKFWDRMLDGSTINNSRALANNLASDSFSTEVKP